MSALQTTLLIQLFGNNIQFNIMVHLVTPAHTLLWIVRDLRQITKNQSVDHSIFDSNSFWMPEIEV